MLIGLTAALVAVSPTSGDGLPTVPSWHGAQPAALTLALAAAPRTAEGERIASTWGRVFAPPAEHHWSLGVSVGRLQWQEAYGRRTGTLALRATARRGLADLMPGGRWLCAGLVVDSSWVDQGSNQLRFVNSRNLVGLSGGFLHWFGRYRLDAVLEAGGLLRTSQLDDGQKVRHNVALSPAVGLSAGGGVSIASAALLGVRAGLRFHPDRLDFLFLLDADWLVNGRRPASLEAAPAKATEVE